MTSHLLKISASVLFSLSCFGNAPLMANPVADPVADPVATEELQIRPLLFNDPKPPRQGSPSGRRRGGASRGPCRQFENLAALVPSQADVVWGQTSRDRPSVWVYLPAPLTPQTPIEFVVQDAADQEIYNTRIVAPSTKSGLIKMTLPATAKPLAVGQPYFWTISVYCNPSKPSEAVFVKGMVQRVAPPTGQKNAPASISSPTFEQVRLAAANGLWYDALDTLAELYQAQPNNPQLVTTWADLLKPAGLANLTTVPFSTAIDKN
jgi:Domain of Unknown Function (DUF928)